LNCCAYPVWRSRSKNLTAVVVGWPARTAPNPASRAAVATLSGGTPSFRKNGAVRPLSGVARVADCQGVSEANALRCKLVETGRLHHPVAVGAERFGPVVVRDEEHDVAARGTSRRGEHRQRGRQHQYSHRASLPR